MAPPLVFISYSRRDKPYKEELCRYLKQFEVYERLRVWDDSHLKPGDDWREEIEAALRESHVAVQLVTLDYLSSTFVKEVEGPAMAEGSGHRKLKMYPILAGRCKTGHVGWLRRFQLRTDDGTPIWLLDDARRDVVLLDIAGEIAAKAEGAAQSPRPEPATRGAESQHDPATVDGTARAGRGRLHSALARLLTPEKTLWYTLALLLTLLCFWFYIQSISNLEVTKPLSISRLFTVFVSGRKYVSRGQSHDLNFTVANTDGSEHEAGIELRDDDGRMYSIEPRLFYEGRLKGKSQSKPLQVQIRLPNVGGYFDYPQPAGLSLVGRDDDGSFRPMQLPLFITSFHKIGSLEYYLFRSTATLGIIFVFCFCFWQFKRAL